MLLYHSIPVPPYLEYSIIPSASSALTSRHIVNEPIPGMLSSKLMHDFSATHTHTIVLDLPLHLDPLRSFAQPMIRYEPLGKARFGVFSRHDPSGVKWFESERGACCIFHTACAWDDVDEDDEGVVTGVNMLACRLNSASLLYSAGNVIPPPNAFNKDANTGSPEDERCELYHYHFDLTASTITHEFALSSIPFEFPATHPMTSMSGARYVYGCTMREGSFSAGLGRTAKVDCLVKMDVRSLTNAGLRSNTPIGGTVDTRSVQDILDTRHDDDATTIRVFAFPQGIYAQEPSFIPRSGATEEDDGWLVTYVFDEEAGLDVETGEVKDGSRSELWVIDAKTMVDVVARVVLPQRG